MSSIPDSSKVATVTMTFTVTMNLPANPSLATLEKVRASAVEARAALAKLGGLTVGTITIGKQKFSLED
jgi:hypothetical protein